MGKKTSRRHDVSASVEKKPHEKREARPPQDPSLRNKSIADAAWETFTRLCANKAGEQAATNTNSKKEPRGRGSVPQPFGEKPASPGDCRSPRL